MTEQAAAPEFSVEIDLDALPGGGKTFRLDANAAERAAVARRIGACAVECLGGEVRLVATPNTVAVTGRVKAELVRECVASLEELAETIDETFEMEFHRAVTDANASETEEPWDAPEIHEGPVFDAGEFIVQQLSLAMDPFPRKPGAPSLAEEYGRAREGSAFSGLAAEIENLSKKQ